MPKIKTTVSLLEDDPKAAAAIISALEGSDQFSFLKWYINGSELFSALRGNEPEIMILDFELPDTNALSVLHWFREKHAYSGKSLVFTVFEKEDLLIQAIASGAAGYLLKGISPELLISELNCIRLGGSSISSKLSAHILENLAGNKVTFDAVSLTSNLSKREEEVLNLISLGYTYEMTARHLEISVSTIRSHITRVYEKLGVKNRADAIHKGIQSGILNQFRSGWQRQTKTE